VSRSGERLAILGLVVVVVLLVTVPALGDSLRGIVTWVFGDTLSPILGTVANIIAVGGFLTFLFRWLRSGSGPLTVHSVSTENNTTMDPDDGVRTLRDDARNAARQIRRFTNERDEDDPFHREVIPENMESPKYEALAARYDEHMNETRRLYRSDHLPTVVGVRDAFADLGIRDPELDRLHENPKNYSELRILADRLITMADSLPRQARTS
jgi:hypothetical protein